MGGAPYPGVAGDLRRLPGRLARPPRPRTGDPSPATRGRDRVAKAHAARATLAAELGRDTGAGELAGRLVEAIEAASTSVALEGTLHGLAQPEHTVIVLRHGIGGSQAKSSRTSPRSSA